MSCVILLLMRDMVSFRAGQLNYNPCDHSLHTFLFTCPICIVALHRPVRACSFFSLLQLLRGAAGGGLLRLLLAAAGAAAHAAGGGQRRALHNAAEDVVGGKKTGADSSLYL